MTKEVITPAQAMQYLNMLVALDNSQIAKDTLKYFENLQKENEKLQVKLDKSEIKIQALTNVTTNMFIEDTGTLRDFNKNLIDYEFGLSQDESKNKRKLIKLISEHSDRYGDLLVKCMNKFNKNNTNDLTVDELEEFIKEEGLLNKEEEK